jgi:hypothetical protein
MNSPVPTTSPVAVAPDTFLIPTWSPPNPGLSCRSTRCSSVAPSPSWSTPAPPSTGSCGSRRSFAGRARGRAVGVSLPRRQRPHRQPPPGARGLPLRHPGEELLRPARRPRSRWGRSRRSWPARRRPRPSRRRAHPGGWRRAAPASGRCGRGSGGGPGPPRGRRRRPGPAAAPGQSTPPGRTHRPTWSLFPEVPSISASQRVPSSLAETSTPAPSKTIIPGAVDSTGDDTSTAARIRMAAPTTGEMALMRATSSASKAGRP